jgi:hypothetical protein
MQSFKIVAYLLTGYLVSVGGGILLKVKASLASAEVQLGLWLGLTNTYRNLGLVGGSNKTKNERILKLPP